MKKRNTLKTHRKQLCIRIATALGVGILSNSAAWADWATCADQGGGKVLCNGSGSVANGDMYKIAGFTDVEINLTGSGNPAGGPAGFGIYLNNGNVTITADTLKISTNGSGADAIRTNGGILTYDGQLTINSNGSSGDGINASNSNNGAATVKLNGSGAYIYSKNGVGIRANLTANASAGNEVWIGQNATVITSTSGDNGTAGKGYALYAGDRLYDAVNMPRAGTALIVMDDGSTIQTSGSKAHAVYANKTGVIQLGNTNITTTGANAHGIAAEDGYVIKCPGGTMGMIQCIGRPENYPKDYFTGGQVYLTGDTAITVDASSGSYAMYASGTDSLITSGTMNSGAASGVFNVKGNLVADNGGKIDLVAKDNSYFEGQITTSGGTGTVNLNMTGANSEWNLTGDSQVTNLNLTGGAKVVFHDLTQDPVGIYRADLYIEHLSGNGEFHVKTNIVRDGGGHISVNPADRIYITGSSSGVHKLFVNDICNGTATGTEAIRIIESVDQGATFVLGNTGGTVDVGAYSFILEREDRLVTRASVGHWSLVPTTRLNNMAQNSVGLLNTNYLMSHIETQTLLQRMGELRTPGNQGDVWARAYTGKLSSFGDDRIGGHDFKYNGMQFGVDRQLDIEAANGRVYIGGMVGYTKGDTDYNVGSGETEAYHAGIYGTYIMDNGIYVDGLLKYQHLKNSVSSFTGGGYYVDGSDSSSGVSVGLEVGKRFYLQQPDQGWYLEPQGQLTYTHQGSSTIEGSNGLRTDLSSYKSTIGRVSIIAGYEVVDGANPVNVYVKTGYVREFDGKANYTFNQTARENYDFSGGWWDNGIGVNMRINNKHNLYAEASYAKGSRFDKQQVNFGYRYEF